MQKRKLNENDDNDDDVSCEKKCKITEALLDPNNNRLIIFPIKFDEVITLFSLFYFYFYFYFIFYFFFRFGVITKKPKHQFGLRKKSTYLTI